MEYQQLTQAGMVQIIQARLLELESEHLLLCVRLSELDGIEDAIAVAEATSGVMTLRRSLMHQINTITMQIENAKLFLSRVITKREDIEDSNAVD